MEGVGNEVLFSLGVVIPLIILLIWYLCSGGPEEEVPDLGDGEPRPPVYNPNTCPICWNVQTFAIETNCGHLYCGPCFKTYYTQNLGGALSSTCPMCRQRVGLLFLCFSNAERNSTGEEVAIRNEITAFVRRYNRMMSNNLTFFETICEIPILLRHLLMGLFVGDNFAPFNVRIRLIIVIVATIMYILVPYDIVPEFIYGLYGYIEDAFILFVLVFYLTRFYRNFIADDE